MTTGCYEYQYISGRKLVGNTCPFAKVTLSILRFGQFYYPSKQGFTVLDFHSVKVMGNPLFLKAFRCLLAV